jgi:hypothetical protein
MVTPQPPLRSPPLFRFFVIGQVRLDAIRYCSYVSAIRSRRRFARVSIV